MRFKRNAVTPFGVLARTFRALCIGVDTPRSLKAWLLFKNEEFLQLAEMKVHPTEYCNADPFAVDYLVVSYLKKNADLPKVADTKAVAIAAFKRSEDTCSQTNERIEAWEDGRLSIVNHRVSEVIHLAQRKISRLLQCEPNLTTGTYSWGPGATIDVSRKRAYPDTKLVQLPLSVTGGAWKHAVTMINADLHWKAAIIANNASYTGEIFTILPGGRHDTVTKTVLTDRSILVEPRLNTILQKKVGAQLRALLKRVGVDLDDQSRNQYLASLARELGLATLDLEAASDSIARKVVRLLLPDTWYTLLDDLRSQWVLLEGQWTRLEKFSSMGNGFTFELESLIFWALAAAATELECYNTVGIYGDDVIVRKEVAPLLTETFAFLGFTLNKSKSFVEGEFYESCGHHFFGGINVTPVYQKSVPSEPGQILRAGNRLLRVAARLGAYRTLDKRVAGAWSEWKRGWAIRPEYFGPFIGEGDGYLEVPYRDLGSHRPERSGLAIQTFRVATYVSRPVEIPAFDDAMYAIWLQKRGERTEQPPWWCSTFFHSPSGWGKTCAGMLSLLSDLKEEISVQKRGKLLKVSSPYCTVGAIDSRVQTRDSIQHRSVMLNSWSYLDW